MDATNGRGWQQHGGETTAMPVGTLPEDLGAQGSNQGIVFPAGQAVPTNLMVAGNDHSSHQPTGKLLSEYISQHCHSLRNLIPAAQSQSEELSPASLLNVAEQRSLSIAEMDCMQQHIRLQPAISINNKLYKLETLPEDTPLFYQFYCQDAKARIDDESIRIFNNNCAIENSRPAIIFMNRWMINETVAAQIEQLKLENTNVHIVDVSRLLAEYTVAGMTITGSKTGEGQFYLTVNAINCSLKDQYFTDGKVRDYPRFSNILDILQFAAMYHCDKVCTLAGVKTGSKGCIKIDWDMELIAPIGTLQCPDGFSAFVFDRFSRSGTSNNELTHSLRVENSLVAVTRPQHRIMAESICPRATGVYRHFTQVVSSSFNQSPFGSVYDIKQVTAAGDEIEIASLKMMSEITTGISRGQQLSIRFNTTKSWKQKIAFPLKSLKADQSRVWGTSSWQKNLPSLS